MVGEWIFFCHFLWREISKGTKAIRRFLAHSSTKNASNSNLDPSRFTRLALGRTPSAIAPKSPPSKRLGTYKITITYTLIRFPKHHFVKTLMFTRIFLLPLKRKKEKEKEKTKPLEDTFHDQQHLRDFLVLWIRNGSYYRSYNITSPVFKRELMSSTKPSILICVSTNKNMIRLSSSPAFRNMMPILSLHSAIPKFFAISTYAPSIHVCFHHTGCGYHKMPTQPPQNHTLDYYAINH